MAELRVTWGDSDRKAGTTSVHKSVNRPGPVWVVIVQRQRVEEWRAMWYFGTRELAEEYRPQAEGRDGNGGIVLKAEVAQGLAYIADRPFVGATRPNREKTRMCSNGCGYALPLTGVCDHCG